MHDHHTSGADESKRTIDFVAEAENELRRRIAGEATTVVLLGASGDGLDERTAIAQDLAGRGIRAIIPEGHFPHDVPLSLVERVMFSAEEVDLIFVNVQSWGSAAEFTELSGDAKTVRKLRLLVARKHHPLYGSPPSGGYLTDAYMTHEAVFGHVYM
ncbi:MAG: hypothetical protein ACRD6W_12595, partial [Nitrososphaerales archaeon]